MSDTEWTFAVVAVFIVTALAWGWWNKDLKGAAMIVVAIILVFAVVLSVSGCEVSPARRPWVEVGLAYDFPRTVGEQPTCVVRVRAPAHFGPIPEGRLIVGYQHMSSCPDLFDVNTIDALEVMAVIPLGRVK